MAAAKAELAERATLLVIRLAACNDVVPVWMHPLSLQDTMPPCTSREEVMHGGREPDVAAAAAELAKRLARPGGPPTRAHSDNAAPPATAAARSPAAGPPARHASQRAGAPKALPLKRARPGEGNTKTLHGGPAPELQPLKRSRHAGEPVGGGGVQRAGLGSPRAGAGSSRIALAQAAPQQRPLSADDVVRQHGAARAGAAPASRAKTGASRLDTASLAHAAAPMAPSRVPKPSGNSAAGGAPGAGLGSLAAAGNAWGYPGPGGPLQGLLNGVCHSAGLGLEGWQGAVPAGVPGFLTPRDAVLAAEQQRAVAANAQSADRRLMQRARRLQQARSQGNAARGCRCLSDRQLIGKLLCNCASLQQAQFSVGS